jgi:endonuclease-3
MINFNDLEFIYREIDTRLIDAPRLYISHELKDIIDIQDKAFKVLVSSVISLRTKEAVTWKVSENVFAKIKNYQQLMNQSTIELMNLLYPCGFYKRKAEQLKKIAEIILTKYQGKTPDKLEELLELPGVGRKVANLVITEVFDEEGICVDTHVHRIANRWQWVKTSLADETEMKLRQVLPKKYWKSINQYLVLLGQNICLPRNPKCNDCFLNDKCPYVSSSNERLNQCLC